MTVLEFPLYFADVVASDGLGLTLLFLRNGLLVAATLLAARALWQATVPRTAPAPLPSQPARAGETPVSS